VSELKNVAGSTKLPYEATTAAKSSGSMRSGGKCSLSMSDLRASPKLVIERALAARPHRPGRLCRRRGCGQQRQLGRGRRRRRVKRGSRGAIRAPARATRPSGRANRVPSSRVRCWSVRPSRWSSRPCGSANRPSRAPLRLLPPAAAVAASLLIASRIMLIVFSRLRRRVDGLVRVVPSDDWRRPMVESPVRERESPLESPASPSSPGGGGSSGTPFSRLRRRVDGLVRVVPSDDWRR
jgi:hypothetical protein